MLQGASRRANHRRLAAGLLGLFVCASWACGSGGEGDASAAQVAQAIAGHEDAVCGMVVREQPAPRGQAVHRDGSRFFFCSIGDLLVHLAAPSPHGRADSVFVEAMRADDDPRESHTGARPWVRAEDAVYVVGIPRPGIMGEPVLSYAERPTAETVASRHAGAEVLDLTQLRDRWAARQAGR